jgi:hypothetical protein
MTPDVLLDRLKREANRLGEPLARAENLDELIDAFYLLPGNGSGGLLHVVLDDCNYETVHVELCRDEARTTGDEHAFWLAQILLAMTEHERCQILDGEDTLP